MGIYKFSRAIAVFTVIGGVVASTSLAAYAATLTSASLSLSDSRINQTSQYTFTGSNWTTATAIGCVEVDLGTAADGTGTPTSASTASSTLVSQSITGTGTWTVDNTQSGSQKLRATNGTPVVPQSGARTIVFGAVTNGSVANTSYFAKVTTYTSNTCATPVDTVTVQFVFTDGQAASVSVDSTLTFSVAGITGDNVATVSGATISNALATTASTIPFGTATTASNRIAAQNLSVATNAGTGYTVFARYLDQLKNASAVAIPDLATFTNASPGAFSAAGTAAFGYTTEDATLGTGTTTRFSGSNKWAAMSTTNSEIIFNGAPAASETVKVGYQVGVSALTAPGTYNTTVIYTATPIY